MRYTKPEIQNESKATTQIMGVNKKKGSQFEPPPHATSRTPASAYEADE